MAKKLKLNPHSYGNPLPTFFKPEEKRGGLSDSQITGYIWKGMSQVGFLEILRRVFNMYFREFLPRRKEYQTPRDNWLGFLRSMNK